MGIKGNKAMRYRNCPVCGGNKSHVLKKIDEMSVHSKRLSFAGLVRCCGM